MSAPEVAVAAIAPQIRAEADWEEFCRYLNTWFYRPDTEALACALSICTGHYLIDSDPAWAFIMGPSSSGKTSIVIQACSDLPAVFVESEITSHSLISHKGVGKNPQPSGLLLDMPDYYCGRRHGIILFKDFASMLSKREDERTEIIGQLREVYDGVWKKRTGNMGGTPWMGKVTLLAATTPALEDFWSVKQDLGERFVTIRWPHLGKKEVALAAIRQRKNKDLKNKIKEYGKRMVMGRTTTLPTIPDRYQDRLAEMAVAVATLRGTCKRSFEDKNVFASHSIEEPPRLVNAFSLVMAGHAAMFHREPDDHDFRLALRVARDTVPERRWQFVRCWAAGEPTCLTRSEVVKASGLKYETVRSISKELEELNVIFSSEEKDTKEAYYTLNPEFLPSLRSLFEN